MGPQKKAHSPVGGWEVPEPRNSVSLVCQEQGERPPPTKPENPSGERRTAGGDKGNWDGWEKVGKGGMLGKPSKTQQPGAPDFRRRKAPVLQEERGG